MIKTWASGKDGRTREDLGFIGRLVAQDVAHVEKLQKGMRTASQQRSAPILSKPQDPQITYFHETYDRLLELDQD